MAEGVGSSFSWDGGTSLPKHGGLSYFLVLVGSWGLVLWLVWGISMAFVLKFFYGSIDFEGWKSFLWLVFLCLWSFSSKEISLNITTLGNQNITG
jgi:hypothetical protein